MNMCSHVLELLVVVSTALAALSLVHFGNDGVAHTLQLLEVVLKVFSIGVLIA